MAAPRRNMPICAKVSAMKQAVRVASVALSLLAAAAGQTTPCPSLRALTGFEFTIATAEAVPASKEVPAHCRVTGQILPEIRFEVYLPSNWNRRFLMRGNGGYAGVMDRGGARRIMQQGFAVAVTDTGHDAVLEPGAIFALNRQKLLDYAFRSLHTTAVAAKQLIRAHYGAAPEKSYWFGCSTGGRQALIMAQRFPDDFDGIIAGAPVLDFTGTMFQFAWISNALAAAPIPLAKMRAVSEAVYRKCDGSDGLEDGLIDDPRRCDLSPSRDLPQCPAGQDNPTCLTEPQLQAVTKIYSPVFANGRQLMPGWPAGAEVIPPNGRSGWSEWILKDDGPTIGFNFADSFFKHMAFERKNPNFDLARLDFDKDSPRVDWLRLILDAVDTDLSAFRARGGKLIMYYGWSDQALNALMGVNYFEAVLQRMGTQTHDFFRFFTVPGMFHCGGGIGCSSFDMLPPLMEWVEKGNAPERVISSRVVDGKTVRTRPLCPYPQTARYRGSGSIDEAASFTCVAP